MFCTTRARGKHRAPRVVRTFVTRAIALLATLALAYVSQRWAAHHAGQVSGHLGVHVWPALAGVITVTAGNLQAGDELSSGLTVVETYNDGPDGVWLETSDGGCGYADRGARFYVVDYDS